MLAKQHGEAVVALRDGREREGKREICSLHTLEQLHLAETEPKAALTDKGPQLTFAFYPHYTLLLWAVEPTMCLYTYGPTCVVEQNTITPGPT